MCNIVIPGYGVDVVRGVTGPQGIPAYPTAGATGLGTASLCLHGFYSANGYCIECVFSAATKDKGATSVEACSEWLFPQSRKAA